MLRKIIAVLSLVLAYWLCIAFLYAAQDQGQIMSTIVQSSYGYSTGALEERGLLLTNPTATVLMDPSPIPDPPDCYKCHGDNWP